MRFLNRPLGKKKIKELIKKYGEYIKITADIEKEWLVAGCPLHADGEKVLLKKGSQQNNIWGGGINLKERLIDSTAVLNIRPNLDNPSIEILSPKRRNKLLKVIKKIFKELWD